jgi:hypothetical protein
MKRYLSILMLLWGFTRGVGAEPNIYSVDPDAVALSEVKLFAFDVIGMVGISRGEGLLWRLVKKDNALKYFMEAYNRGTPEAKVYALAYFHHSAPELFEICWNDIVGKYNPTVRSMSGCFSFEGSLFEQMIRIKRGEYDGYIEYAHKRKARTASSEVALKGR